jgi:hypothetical protein
MGNIEASPTGSRDNGTVYDPTAPTPSALSPAETTEHAFVASWSGDDATSGVATYEAQYRVGSDGTWQDCPLGRTETSAPSVPASR